MQINKQMFEILKLHLEGKSAYFIAREFAMDPPSIYRCLKTAERNFEETERMLAELKALGWPAKLAEVKQELRNRSPRRAATEEPIALKLG